MARGRNGAMGVMGNVVGMVVRLCLIQSALVVSGWGSCGRSDGAGESRVCGRGALILAFFHEWIGDPLASVRTWFRGRAWLRRTRASARDTLTLALSHKGRGDPLASVRTWFRVASLASTVWIPAFAGMTGANGKWRRNDSFIDWRRLHPSHFQSREMGFDGCCSCLASGGGIVCRRTRARRPRHPHPSPLP